MSHPHKFVSFADLTTFKKLSNPVYYALIKRTLAQTAHYYTKFEEGKFYHVYNRTVDQKPMFRSNDNYAFFLRKYDHYLSPVIYTYAYCLLGNHFHLLIRVKDVSDIQLKDIVTSEEFNKPIHEIVSHQFQRFFQSYSMAFNKQHERIGTLFQTPFKRALVDNDNYYKNLVYYIHANAQLHGLVSDFKDWPWSSFGRVLIEKPSKLKKEEVISWFGGIRSFKEFHSDYKNIMLDKTFLLEDE